MLTYDEYTTFYEKHGKTIDQIAQSKPMNSAQIEMKYTKYVKKEDRKVEKAIAKAIAKQDNEALKEFKIDEAWEKCKAEAYELDPDATLFFSQLTNDEMKVIVLGMYGEMGTFDPCHIIGKGRCPKLKYSVENILIAPRVFHHYIDIYKNPFTEKHESITEEQRNEIWIKFIGIERWNYLQYMQTK